jgi:hypothetical protein
MKKSISAAVAALPIAARIRQESSKPFATHLPAEAACALPPRERKSTQRQEENFVIPRFMGSPAKRGA